MLFERRKGDFKKGKQRMRCKVNKHINNIQIYVASHKSDSSISTRQAILNEIYGWHNAWKIWAPKNELFSFAMAMVRILRRLKLHQHKSSIRKWNDSQVEILESCQKWKMLSPPVSVVVCARDLTRTSKFYEEQHAHTSLRSIPSCFILRVEYQTKTLKSYSNRMR